MTKSYPLCEEKKFPITITHDYIQFAQVGRPHGLKGAFFLKTEDRRTKWDNYKEVLVETPAGFVRHHVLKTYLSANALVVVLDGFLNRNDVEFLYLKKIYVHKSEIKLDKEEYLVADLKGYQVVAQEKGVIGNIVNVVSFGAQDNLEIKTTHSKKTFLFPFMDSFIVNVDVEKKEIEIVYTPEFFEDDSPFE